MYITQSEYTNITGDTSISQDKLKMASYLLDSRLGVYCGTGDGLKLEMSQLSQRQQFIVKHWVANMAKTVKQTGGSVQTNAESISLGRFSVDRGGAEGNSALMPDSVKYYDQLLVSSGLINRRVSIRHVVMNTSVYEQLMSHDVVVKKLGLSATGDETVLGSWSEKGFIEYDRHRVVDQKSEEITCNARGFLKNDSHFDPTHDRWAIKDVKNENTMQMKAFRVIDDPRVGKTHHYELSVL